MDLNAQLVINNVSFGECGYHILKQLQERDIYVNLFPISNNLDLSSFDKTSDEFKNYLQLCTTKAHKKYRREFPCLKFWHILGSENSVSNNTYLFTCRELDQISDLERNILNNQKKVFVCCEETKKMFEDYGVTVPVIYVPLGFDNLHFYKKDKKYFDDGRITFLLTGKWEVRKCTERVIKLWIKKYGNNKKYFLELAVHNPFFNPEQMNQLYAKVFDNQRPPFNVNIHPYLANRSLLCDLYNATDIIIDASQYETWSLPSFTAVCLGKHAAIHHVAGVKGWANNDNSVLFFPEKKETAFDGVFFHNRGDFSFGNWYVWSDDEIVGAFEEALQRYEKNPINEEGLKLQQKFTWKNSVDLILKEISN